MDAGLSSRGRHGGGERVELDGTGNARRLYTYVSTSYVGGFCCILPADQVAKTMYAIIYVPQQVLITHPYGSKYLGGLAHCAQCYSVAAGMLSSGGGKCIARVCLSLCTRRLALAARPVRDGCKSRVLWWQFSSRPFLPPSLAR